MKKIDNWLKHLTANIVSALPWILYFCKEHYSDFGRWYRRNRVYKFRSPQKLIFRKHSPGIRRKYGMAPEGVISKNDINEKYSEGSYQVNMSWYEVPYYGGRILPKADNWAKTGMIPDTAKKVSRTMLCDKWEIEYYFKLAD